MPTVNEQGVMVSELCRGTTGWLTNSGFVADELAAFQCRDRFGGSRRFHSHVHLLDSKAVHKSVYTPKLVEAILRGICKQLEADGGIHIGSLDQGYTVDVETRQILYKDEYEVFFDDVTGQELPAEKVREGRMKELEFLHSFPVYVPVPESSPRARRWSTSGGSTSTRATRSTTT